MTYYPRLNDIFVTERLRRKLDEMKSHPITTIIAPMGFGKTTAINWWSKRQTKKQANIVVLRQMIVTDSITDLWSGLCRAFKGYPALAEQMKALGCPKDGRSISILAELLDDALSGSSSPIYYVMDNLYILKQKQLLPLLLFLSRSMPENVHIILLSRNQIFGEEERMRLGNLLCEITVEDLRLNDEELGIYAKHCEIKASIDEIKDLAKSSEGWISMVYLNFKSYVQSGTWLSNSADIFTLINQVLLDPLSENSREFLTLCGMTDEFTKEQAIYLWNNPDAADLLEALTRNNAFITKNENGIYHYHHMLQQCTRQKFSKKSEEYQKESYSRLGLWYLRAEEYISAYYAFYKAKDWDGLFFTVERDRFNSFNTEHSQNLCKWLNECPEEIILKYPSAITSCMLEMFTIHNIPELMRMKELLLKSLEQNTVLTEEERNNLLGDAEISESFLFYNNISAMSDYHRRANSLLSRTSFSIDQKAAWTFTAPSIFMMYHRTVGGADRENEEMKECMPYYYQVSDGHGNGSEYVFQAELFYERGEITDGDISNRISMAHAKRKNQYSIMLNAKILSMRMAVLNGDWETIKSCNIDCREWLLKEKQYTLINTLDISQGFIYSLLEHPEAAPKWFLEGRISEALIMFPAQPMLHTYYNQLLLAKHQWTEVIARHEECKEIYGVYNNVMCQIWLHIQQSAALEKLNRHEDAVVELSNALNMAALDGIIMPFVESQVYIESMLKELREKDMYIETIDHILSLAEEFRRGKQKILWEHWSEHEDYGLSQRELEVAKLAAMRKTNLEIAEELHLAEGTVRNQLSRIFDKLDIAGSGKNKRTKLEDLLKIKK